MSQSALAEAVGLDPTMISKVEKGRRRLDALELSRVAKALSVPMRLLLERRPEVLSRRAVPLADDSDTALARESERMDLTLASWLGDIRQLLALGTLRSPARTSYSASVASAADARLAATWLRGHMRLGLEPVDSMMSLCEKAGQLLLLADLPGDGVSAIDGDIAAAVVSLRGEPGRRRATAAHELGHFLLGDEYSSDLGVSASRAERETIVDAFAAELLLPVQAVAAATGDGAVRTRLVRIAAVYRVSWSLALRQAESADLIDATERRRLSQSTPTRVEFRQAVGWAPEHDLESVRVPPSYADAVINAWRQNLITTTRAAELMHGQISEADLPPRDDLDAFA
jgi:Zn-dependent peptidase ImmA (M78 family)/transcriptional regulator with XRE-family HTH domain